MKLLLSLLLLLTTLVAEEENYLRERLAKLMTANKNHFSLMPYKKNYFVYSQLFAGANTRPYDAAYPASPVYYEDYELQLQVSLMVPIWLDMFDLPLTTYVAYTNRSFWQFFDLDDSQAFRETNHEPEIWLAWFYDFYMGDLNAEMVWLGFEHQSNGQYIELSRGWNRVYLDFYFNYDAVSLSIRPWIAMGDGAHEDEVYDYEKYLGSGEIHGVYTWKHFDLGATWDYSFSGLQYGSVMLDLDIPMSNYVSGYVRYFHGYGESLIDFDYRANTLSVGIVLDTW